MKEIDDERQSMTHDIRNRLKTLESKSRLIRSKIDGTIRSVQRGSKNRATPYNKAQRNNLSEDRVQKGAQNSNDNVSGHSNTSQNHNRHNSDNNDWQQGFWDDSSSCSSARSAVQQAHQANVPPHISQQQEQQLVSGSSSSSGKSASHKAMTPSQPCHVSGGVADTEKLRTGSNPPSSPSKVHIHGDTNPTPPSSGGLGTRAYTVYSNNAAQCPGCNKVFYWRKGEPRRCQHCGELFSEH